jgi:SAM-dependent methyltransferase
MQDTTMRDYYAQRAANYEDIYRKPERQSDLLDLEQRISAALQDRKVLEVACGTGYWTERFAPSAQSVTASDYNQAMLDIAEQKTYSPGRVQFALADAYDAPAGDYDACFAGFLWSHVKREDQARLLAKLAEKAGGGSLLVMADNNYVEGQSSPVARTDAEGNTYQMRTQADGTRVEIVKNFPTDSFLRKKLGAAVRDIRIYRNTYYWLLTCVLK